jgi:serine/threonine protein kinase
MKSVTLNQDGAANIGGRKIVIPHYKLSSLIGRGANGVVFCARHVFLGREDAVKVWLKLKPTDDRDKFLQGIEEARKAASINSSYVIPIHYAGDADGLFYCSMEYLKGPTLRELLGGKLYCDFSQKHALASLFLDSVFKTSRNGIFHGDLHTKNIIVLKHSIRILDFGTSRFTSPVDLEKRHWKTVHETFKSILSPFDIDELYRGIPLYAPAQFIYADDPQLSILPPSMYRFFLAQLPFFILDAWANDPDVSGFDRTGLTSSDTRREAATIHPAVSARLQSIKQAVSVDELLPLVRRLEMIGDPERGGFFRIDWSVRENEAVEITLHYKGTA